MLADQAIRAGDAELIVAGGMESMSRAPYLLEGLRQGWKFGDQKAVDSMLHDGLWSALRGLCAWEPKPTTLRQHARSRAAIRTRLLVESHRRAVSAAQDGDFAAEIVAVTVRAGKVSRPIDRDEGPRADTHREALSALKPVFGAAGTVTAGNSSQLSDGAAAVVVVSEAIAQRHDSPLRPHCGLGHGGRRAERIVHRPGHAMRQRAGQEPA